MKTAGNLTRSPQSDRATGTHSNAGRQSAAVEAPSYGLRFVDAGDHADLPIQRKKNNTGLPDNLRAGIEQLSGLDMSDVRVHLNSSQPTQFQALAYAKGTNIHLAPGQERYLPHEAWHVVQQAQGRVKPTMQLKDGVPANDNEDLEREADVMGANSLSHAAQLPGSGGQLGGLQRKFVTPQRMVWGRGHRAIRHAPDATIQRLPTARQVKDEVGDPKEKATKSLKYKSFLQALVTYNESVTKMVAKNANGIAAQRLSIIQSLDGVIQAAAAYNAVHNSDARAKLIASIGQQAVLEKAVVNTRAAYYTDNPPVLSPMWFSVIPNDLGTRTRELTKGTITDRLQGGINTVTEHTIDNFTGFFKEDKAQITDRKEISQADTLGIPHKNPKFANRSVATYRLDQLLGANIIARTQFATQGKVKGTISEKAGGAKLGTLLNERQLANVDAPLIQRALSKLDMMDALCLQMDRHAGNIYVDIDNLGNPTNVIGIDNDAAFPGIAGSQDKFKKVDKPETEFSGVSRYFDKEMAEMVLKVDEADLRTVLADLLSHTEIELVVARLRELKLKIQTAKQADELLEPHEWNATTAQNQRGNVGGYKSWFSRR